MKLSDFRKEACKGIHPDPPYTKRCKNPTCNGKAYFGMEYCVDCLLRMLKHNRGEVFVIDSQTDILEPIEDGFIIRRRFPPI